MKALSGNGDPKFIQLVTGIVQVNHLELGKTISKHVIYALDVEGTVWEYHYVNKIWMKLNMKREKDV